MSQLSQRPTSQHFARHASLALAAAVLLAPIALYSQSVTVTSDSSKTSDRWLHVRVVSTESKNETVRVNVPLEMAEKVLPAINKDRLHNGKVRFNDADMNGVDLKTLLDAVHTAKDGEFVTVQSSDSDVRVAKQNGYMLVHVIEKHSGSGKDAKSTEKSSVDVKIPMKVVDALFSAGKDELDLVAALHALSAHGDTELVSVRSDDNTVRVWLDSKNISD
jgi:WD40 repeat protein